MQLFEEALYDGPRLRKGGWSVMVPAGGGGDGGPRSHLVARRREVRGYLFIDVVDMVGFIVLAE